jgi:uncharacterized membrane protein YcaP (DUF421 family)
MWHHMFVLGVPVLEKILRAGIVYIFLIVGLRLAGKRELAQLNPFDLVVLLTLSNTVQNAIIGDDNSITGGIIGATALLLINYLVIQFLFKHDRIDRIVEGEADVLIDHGNIQEYRLQKEFLTKHELEIAAHRQGFGDLKEVEQAAIEPGGGIFFVAKKPSTEEVQQAELIKRLDAITLQLAELRSKIDAVRKTD